MTDLLTTLGNLIASLGNVQSAAVLREHVALLQAKLVLIAEHLEALEKENAQVIGENARLRHELSRQHQRQQFVQARGALFVPLPGGGYEETPVCPKCHSAMSSTEIVFPFICGDPTCRMRANFTLGDLPAVLKSLP